MHTRLKAAFRRVKDLRNEPFWVQIGRSPADFSCHHCPTVGRPKKRVQKRGTPGNYTVNCGQKGRTLYPPQNSHSIQTRNIRPQRPEVTKLHQQTSRYRSNQPRDINTSVRVTAGSNNVERVPRGSTLAV